MNRPIKSLGKFTPRVDPALRTRLAGNSKPEPALANGTNPAPAKEQQLGTPKVDTGHPVTIKIECYVELINDPQKLCPAYAYLGRGDPEGLLRIVAVLNRALWPAAAALARGDGNALRWLVALAITDRCLSWPTHPILRATSRHLTHAALGDKGQDYQAGLWTAYKLKEHALFAIEKLSILKGNAEHSPEKFAEFNVEVDSVRLEGWRAKFAAKKKHPIKPHALAQ